MSGEVHRQPRRAFSDQTPAGPAILSPAKLISTPERAEWRREAANCPDRLHFALHARIMQGILFRQLGGTYIDLLMPG